MLSKDFRFSCAYFCFVFWFMNHPIKGHGSNLKCCFGVLKNNSVSYQLSERPEPSCTTTWSYRDVVVVDENGNVDKNIVEHHEPQKLILKVNMDEKPKQVMYRKDCQEYGYKAECTDPCATGNIPTSTEATHSTAAPSEDNRMSIIAIGILLFLIIIIIIIILFIVCYKINHSSTSNCTPRVLWSKVPQNAASQVSCV